MRVAFFGTPTAALPSLDALAVQTDVVGVVTRPDRPRGRSGRPVPAPVAERAGELGLPVFKPERRSDLGAAVESLAPFDVSVVVAFGMIIPPDVLAVPAHGFINVHFSLLPRWRGAAPVERSILAGDETTGVSIMVMDEGLDSGPVIGAESIGIGQDEGAGELTGRLARLGAGLLVRLLPRYLRGVLTPEPQDEARATYARKIEDADRRITVDGRAADLMNVVRAAEPVGAYATYEGERFKLHRAGRLLPAHGEPGTLRIADDGGLFLTTADASVELLEVQPASKRRMAGDAWARGRAADLAKLA